MINKLIDFQKDQRQLVIDKIDAARAAIEAEFEQLGYYPHNNGSLNAKELCRRAGVGASTLKNKTHERTRASVKAWLKRMKLKAGAAPRSAKGNDATALERSLNLLARELDCFKLQYEEIETRCAELEGENERLRRVNAELLSGRMKVVEFPQQN